LRKKAKKNQITPAQRWKFKNNAYHPVKHEENHQFERNLRKMATKGVVRLFTAITNSRRKVKSTPEGDLNTLSEDAFLKAVKEAKPTPSSSKKPPTRKYPKNMFNLPTAVPNTWTK